MSFRTIALFALASMAAACGSDTIGGNEAELITTVSITFTPVAANPPVTFEFDDPDGDGGDPPTIDAIDIGAGEYNVTVGFENRLETPPEIITDEVRDEGVEHQVFLTGDAVDGPATSNPGAPLLHAYADQDLDGLPIGLSNTITASAGSGTLTLTLRHLPPQGGTVVKVLDLASQVASGGLASIGGESDVSVDFAVTVQ